MTKHLTATIDQIQKEVNIHVTKKEHKIIGDISRTGPVGPQGKEGKSAYELWLAEGNVGSVSDFLSEKGHTYIHEQISASTEWYVEHNLGRKPAVTVVDSGDNVVIGDIKFLSNDVVLIVFSVEFGGKAYFN